MGRFPFPANTSAPNTPSAPKANISDKFAAHMKARAKAKMPKPAVEPDADDAPGARGGMMGGGSY